jgi:MPBQ/MSBQ methyltransferase
MPLVQHKQAAYWFYRFLSLVYDRYVNPLFWNERMREEALALARLKSNLRVIDVGSGTGFTTQGIVKQVSGRQVVCVDQSPHQMSKAKAKQDLQDCTFSLGDAENIPCQTDEFDRYVSAGSIEYWPDPQQGIREAYRVIRPGGLALMIGPLEPRPSVIRFIARTWMLFPREEDDRKWFTSAGFEDIQVQYIRPQWYRGKEEYAVAMVGVKPESGTFATPPSFDRRETIETGMVSARWITLFGRVAVGSFLGFLFIPIALAAHLKNSVFGTHHIPPSDRERLNVHQTMVLLMTGAAVVALGWIIN